MCGVNSSCSPSDAVCANPTQPRRVFTAPKSAKTEQPWSMMDREVVHTARNDIRFDVPLYTVSEAAHALGVPSTTLSTWAFGYVRRTRSGGERRGSAVLSTVQATRGPTIPFVGLAEGMVLAAIRRAGVPLQRVRPALEVLQKEIGLQHALASRRLYTDGAELLFDHVDTLPDDEAQAVHDLVVIRSGQRVFTEVIKDYLSRIEYGRDGYAKVIRIPAYEKADVIADPTRSFGQPVFARGGVRVSDVLERFWSGEDIQELSEEFGVPQGDIEDVLRATSRRAA
jgi:uncharacterized protein (DUF433 family)